MQILSSENSLRSYLLKQHGTKLQIVSAFAYETAGVVEQLKSQSNAVELIVGTINAFTDPDFIEDAARTLPKGLWVDFRGQRRSEEHTSELQSLMRISYAVFCLKKKNTNDRT